MIITKDSTVINRLPISVTAHSGMLSKKLHSSTAVMISVGRMVSWGEPYPAALMMVDTTPWMMLSRPIISSRP